MPRASKGPQRMVAADPAFFNLKGMNQYLVAISRPLQAVLELRLGIILSFRFEYQGASSPRVPS